MKDDLKYLVSTFAPRERRLLVVYALIQFVIASLDVVSVAAIFPLMQVVLDAPLDTGVLGTLHSLLGSQSRRSFVITLAAVMIAAFILKAVIGALANWWGLGFIARLQTRTSRRLLSVYMSEDYLTHRGRNSADLMRTVGSAVQAAHASVLGGILGLLSSSLSMGLIAILLLVVAPLPTVIATIYFGVVVFVIQRVLAPLNRRAGADAQQASWVSSHALVDAMFGFREAVLHDAQGYFVDRYDDGNVMAVQAGRRANFFSLMPKYLLELVTMAGLVLLIVVEVLAGSARNAMPTLSLFVASTIKILPLMVALTATMGTIRVGRDGLSITVKALRGASSVGPPAGPAGNSQVLPQHGTIRIESVSFHYPDGNQNVLESVNLEIPAGSSLALCGASGSGKTTLVDIILGLIPPTSGQVTYDGRPTTTAGSAWHNVVAYVPQDVYIADDTLAGNIAFAVAEEDRDEQHLRDCVRHAQLEDLVNDLPDGVDTRVGERGSRLSGGQRQRLGIARALYRRPSVLVLDEATSALDNVTEHEITATMRSLSGTTTTILVAHRLSSVKHVDQLAFLSSGRVEAVGTFSEVARKSAHFSRLVSLGRLDNEEISSGETRNWD
ncbi:ABC transporter ATP-binding protein [Calidifontibacter terrae]